MPSSTISTIERVLEILDVFSEDNSTLSVAVIAERLGRPKSTVYRHVEVLKQAGLLEERPPGGAYRLGLKILSLARIVRSSLSIIEVALPVMRKLCASTGETAVLAVPCGLHGVYVEQVESQYGLRIMYQRGQMLPLHASACGKTLLAHMGEDPFLKVVNQGLTHYTPYTITDPEALRRQLEQIRQQGYGYSFQELHMGATGVAAPILDFWGNPVAALGVAGPVGRIPTEKLQQMAALVIAEAAHIQSTGWY